MSLIKFLLVGKSKAVNLSSVRLDRGFWDEKSKIVQIILITKPEILGTLYNTKIPTSFTYQIGFKILGRVSKNVFEKMRSP